MPWNIPSGAQNPVYWSAAPNLKDFLKLVKMKSLVDIQLWANSKFLKPEPAFPSEKDRVCGWGLYVGMGVCNRRVSYCAIRRFNGSVTLGL